MSNERFIPGGVGRRVISTTRTDYDPESSYGINDGYVRALVAEGRLPEPQVFPFSRFDEKLYKHRTHRYTDARFWRTAEESAQHARNLVERLKGLPYVMAVGLAGSLARPQYLGWHPDSDIDMYVVTDVPTSVNDDGINKVVEEYVTVTGIRGFDLLGWTLDSDREATSDSRVFVNPQDVMACYRRFTPLSHKVTDTVWSKFREAVATHHLAKILYVDPSARDTYYNNLNRLITQYYQEYIIAG